MSADYEIYGWWDVFNQVLYKAAGEAEKAKAGGNKVITLYVAPEPAVSGRRANDTQVGGTHYMKHGNFQPWDAWWLWKLNAFQGAIIKYVVRYRDKNGLQDLEKAGHYLEKLIECEREELAGKEAHKEYIERIHP